MDDIFRSYIIPAIIAGCVSFAAAAFSGYMVHRNTKRQLEVSYITDKRVEWIQELRKTMSEYMALVFKIVNAGAMNEKVTLQMIGDLNLKAFYLELLLNCKGKIDTTMLDTIDRINTAVKKHEYENIQSDINILFKHTQVYLKLEWNRVKMEVKGKKYTDIIMESQKAALYKTSPGDDPTSQGF